MRKRKNKADFNIYNDTDTANYTKESINIECVIGSQTVTLPALSLEELKILKIKLDLFIRNNKN